MAAPTGSRTGKCSGIWQGLEGSNEVLGQDWLDQHAGRSRGFDSKTGRGFVRPGQEDDLAGMGLPDLADRLDAIQSAPQANMMIELNRCRGIRPMG